MRKSAEIASEFAHKEDLNGKTSFFLVGIGGAGMSALARMLKHRGFRVRGTDSTLSPEVGRLRAEGFDIKVGHSGEGISSTDAVVLTDAIDLDTSPEVDRAREVGAPLFRRSQALGWLLKPYKVIAVTGTHGKTTTTGMTGAALIEAGFDPLVVVGASIPEWGGPVREGKGEWAVVEACEAYDSFHDISPEIVVLTNLELDHSDFHGTYEGLESSVLRFVESVPKTGLLVYCQSDVGAAEVARKATVALKEPYGEELLSRVESMNWNSHVGISLPGQHNRLNASGAILAAENAGANIVEALYGAAQFRGAERRLQLVHDGDVTVVDDYAHHPTEIVASLSALRERYPERRLIAAFQPHLYSRTADNIKAFATALSGADVVFLTDIYPAREDPIPGVSSARIAELVTQVCRYVPSRHLLPRRVAAIARPGDVVVGMGAGNIAEFPRRFVEEWEKRKGLKAIDDGVLPPSLKVAVVLGGDSSEREVSILSGNEIVASLERQGVEAMKVDVSELLLGSGDLGLFTGASRPDLAFLAVHGTHAEDGAIQGLFELAGIPYTGSGIQASATAMDKNQTKSLLSAEGIRVPTGRLVTAIDQLADMSAPAIVKPNAEGSTVGLSFVERSEQLAPAVEKALAYGGACLVEEWVRGMEISVPVLGDRPLPPVEIAPASGQYDFESKYTPGATEEIVPARLPDAVLEESMAIALKCHRILGCEGATRTDMIVSTGNNGSSQIYVLEVNTLPGMTSTSLLPNSARSAGIDFDELVRWLVIDALRRHVAKT